MERAPVPTLLDLLHTHREQALRAWIQLHPEAAEDEESLAMIRDALALAGMTDELVQRAERAAIFSARLLTLVSEILDDPNLAPLIPEHRARAFRALADR